jgi:hypothetical protein
VGILDDAIREHLELKRSRGAADAEIARQESEALGPARREPPAAMPLEGAAGPLLDAPPPPDPSAAVSAQDGAPPPPEVLEPLEPVAAFEPPEEFEPPEPAGAPEPVAPFAPLDEIEPLPADDDGLPDIPPPGSIEPPLDRPLHAEPALEDPIAPPPAPVEPPVVADAGPPTEAMYAGGLPDVLPPDDPAADAAPDDLDDLEATQVRPLPPLDDDALPPEPALPPVEPAPIEEPPIVEPPIEEPPIAPPPVRPRIEPEQHAPTAEDPLEETPDFLQDTPEHDRLWFEQKPPRDFDFDD